MSTVSPQQLAIETNESVIRAELDRVLAERRFSGAPQMTAFLRYIVNETLAGNADRIKAFSVGVDALGKPDTFDAQSDPSVRVLALRLRKTLASMYQNPRNCRAIIELRVGTYVPSFYQAPDVKNRIENDVSVAAIINSIGRPRHTDAKGEFTQHTVPITSGAGSIKRP